jgi:hypothetical protein
MPLKLSTLQALVLHDIGGPPAEPHTTTSIVNDAGEHLYSMRRWVFAKRRSTQLRFEANNPLVALPPEFARVISITPGNAWIILGSTMQTADVAYTAGSGTGGTFVGHVMYDNGLPFIQVAPTPTANDDQAAILWYGSGWRTLNNPDDVAAVPVFAEGLLKATIAAFAKGYEGDVLTEELNTLRQSEPYMTIKRRDGGVQNFGPLRGGIGQRAYDYNPLVTETAADPA